MIINRTKYLDYIRVISTIFVIIIHVSSQNFYEVNINSYKWMTFNIYDSMSRAAVPLFIMISGALFLNPKKKIATNKLYKKYISRIVISFIFWSLFYVIIDKIKYNYTLLDTIKFFLKGHYHLWYLYTIFGLYVITPILRKITESKELLKYFLFISFITTILISTISIFINNKGLTDIYNNINLYLTRGYTIYYLLGYYLANIDIKKNQRIILYFLGLFSTIAIIILTAFLSIRNNIVNTEFYEYRTIFVFIQAISIFVFFKNNLNKNCNKKVEKIIDNITKASFGIYLIHPIVIESINWIFEINTLSFSPILSVPVLTIIVFIISYILSKLIGKIPIINKYII